MAKNFSFCLRKGEADAPYHAKHGWGTPLWRYLMVNSTAHACVEILVEVMLALQMAPPLAV